MDYFILGIVFIIYFLMVGYVGYLAWKRTNSSEDFMVAGRQTHPYIMALSYGATFISTVLEELQVNMVWGYYGLHS